MTEVLIVAGCLLGLGLYASLRQVLGDIKTSTQRIQGKVNEMSTQGDAIKAVVDKIRTAVDALIVRLSDNVSGQEAADIKTAGEAIGASLDEIDKDVPGGPIEGDEPIE